MNHHTNNSKQTNTQLHEEVKDLINNIPPEEFNLNVFLEKIKKLKQKEDESKVWYEDEWDNWYESNL